MTRQVINIGSTANDRTGDPLRTAFDKTNDNFIELYEFANTIPTAISELDNDLNFISANTDLDLFFSGKVSLGATEENLMEIQNANTYIIHDCAETNSFLHSDIQENFTANFINLGLTSGKLRNITLILQQSIDPHIITNVEIDGIETVVLWQNGITPTGNSNKTDMISFKIFKINTTFIVLGRLLTFG
jgi:hypothetical protein